MKKILAIALVLIMVVALAAPALAADSPKDSGNAPSGGTPGGNAPVKSAQTGYNTVVWVISAVVMAACAGYCFSKSGKKAAC